MPTFEFRCEKCPCAFEELLLTKAETERHADSHPCPVCGKASARQRVTQFSFGFKAPPGRTQGTGVHGNSGVHDLDYPTLDKAVGRSAEKKWGDVRDRKKERDKIRKDSGSAALAIGKDGSVAPLDSKTAAMREKAVSAFSKSRGR